MFRVLRKISESRQKFIKRKKGLRAEFLLPNPLVTALGALNFYRKLQKYGIISRN